MALRDFLGNLFSPIPEPRALTDNDWITASAQDRKLQLREIDPAIEFPGWDAQARKFFGIGSTPWRFPSVKQALGVPAIFRANSLIYNTVGSLAVETYRNGQLLIGDQAPALVKRPDPFTNAFQFYRGTAAYGASRGEAWWWVAKRDSDGLAISLINVPPWEVTVDRTGDRLRPTITWTINGVPTVMDPNDMRHIVFFPDPDGGPRGFGPLQLCGAAVSVAVESTEWAANFYAEGGYPSLVIKAAGSLGETADGQSEADLIRNQFRDKPHNTPRVIDEGIAGVEEFGINEQGAQMLEARFQNRGDVANMYGIPGKLLEYSAPGSSLTYQSVPEVFREWVRSSLQISFLEPIEHALTDLLPRTTVAKFNLDSFERADPMSRWNTYKVMGEVLGTEEAANIARQSEGLAPGDVEFLPVPFSPPAAFPSSLPAAREAEPVRCTGRVIRRNVRQVCGKLLAEQGPFIGTCSRCKTSYGEVLSA